MSKFKKGDMIRCIQKSTCGYVGIINKIYKVSSATSGTLDVYGVHEGNTSGVDPSRFELVTISALWFDEADIKVGDLLLAKTSGSIEKRCIVTYTEGSGTGNELGLVALDGEGFFNALSNYSLNSDGIPMYLGRKIIKIYRASDRRQLSAFVQSGKAWDLKTIWKPEVQVKEVTMADLEAQFGCKVKVIK